MILASGARGPGVKSRSSPNQCHFLSLDKTTAKVEMSGIEPEAFRMRSGRSTTELHPQVHSLSVLAEKKRLLQVRLELTTPAYPDTVYKYRALTDCATGAIGHPRPLIEKSC